MKLAPWEPDLKTVVDRIDLDEIDLQPDFQRQEIWSAPKKRKLIDTILRNWSVPPIFLVVLPDGRMEVLDGQQRLAAIRDFVHNDFSVDGALSPADSEIEMLNGKFYRTLPAQTKRLFEQYTIRCFKITDYKPDEPSELFYRLNQPSMLTAGEQRNAFFGPAREQLKSAVRLFEEKGNVKSSIGFSNARLAYDDILARLFFFIEAGSFGIKTTEAVISQRFRDRSEFAPETQHWIERSINLFSEAREEAEPIRLNKASALSWLLFFSRFPEHESPNLSFMRYFVSLQSASVQKAYEIEAFRLFQDRASLRVTDVSSVVFRDFALWLAYTKGFGTAPPATVSSPLIELIFDTLTDRDDVTLEYVLSQLLDQHRWSSLK